jgi:ComF family protein
VAFGLYQGRLKDAIHALKYDRLHPAARGLGRMLASAIAQLAHDAPAEMLVLPVPLHPTKHAQRGFNQARSLVREALLSLAKTHPAWRLTLSSSVLIRRRATESQAGLTPRERRLNLRGAFAVTDPEAVDGRHVLLIDDIMTTGATARAAAQALMKAGAASVWVATLARARRTRQSHFNSAHGAEDSTSQASSAGIQQQAPAANLQPGNLHSHSSRPISSEQFPSQGQPGF